MLFCGGALALEVHLSHIHPLSSILYLFNKSIRTMMRKSVQNVQKRGITGYAYKVAKGMMPKISGKLNVPTVVGSSSI